MSGLSLDRLRAFARIRGYGFVFKGNAAGKGLSTLSVVMWKLQQPALAASMRRMYLLLNGTFLMPYGVNVFWLYLGVLHVSGNG